MPLCSDVESVLGLLDQMQTKMKQGGGGPADDPRLVSQVNDEINTLLSVLTNPMFQRICKIKDSVNELGDQMIRHPSITTNDFDITPEGSLVVKISPPAERYKAGFDTTMPLQLDTKKGKALTRGPVSPDANKFNGESVTPITTPTYEEEFDRVLKQQAQGRQIHKIGLFKPEGGSLGFSVVGLKSQEKGELGIFVQELQPSGIAARDGRLQEGDQILAIDGQPLDSAITHQQAIGILQQSRGEVEIVIARAPDSAQLSPTSASGDHSIGTSASAGVVQQQPPVLGDRPTSASSINTDSKLSAEMVLNTEWAQVEVIELINDGTGLGFGIIGGRSTGVVVKTILPGGVADRDGRLQSGDHILQIGDVNLLGMGSEQVAAVLRQCGSCVRLVVARPIEPTSPDALSSHAPIVPTRILGDPDELERHLIQSNGYTNSYGMVDGSMMSMGDSSGLSPSEHPLLGDDGMMMGESGDLSPTGREGPGQSAIISGTVPPPFDTLPEVEIVDVELHKDSHGLGITIAGYVCEKEELSGIFVKSISEGSAADLSKRIQINDRIVEVDGQSLQGFTNHEAVEVLRKTGSVVMLKLERYHHGSKYDQLQSAISHSSEHKPPTPSSVSALSLPQVPVDSDNEELAITPGIEEDEEEDDDEDEEEEEEDEELVVETTTRGEDMDLEDLELLIDTRYEGDILATVEAAIMAKWSKIMGPEVEVVVSQLSKAKEGGGLGISLEGTVDVEDGREVRPHHYIRSILSDGPVGRAGQLQSGDELLEVNGRRLLGLNHVEVVSILKDLPMHVRLVCARRPGQPPPSRPIDTAQDRNAFAARNILGGSLQNLFQNQDRLVKAKSDGSLASTGTTNATDTSLSKLKSRSLEPLTGLAMWSPEPHIIELPKGERGLGFSILDYQDPMNPSETVIVIRSLVPGGVAQQDGRLIPGDRLLAVNDTNLENASLDQAVQALKGAPRGIVRIIVAKPLPLPDTTTSTGTSNTTAISTAPQSHDVTPPPLPLSPPPEMELAMPGGGTTKTSKTSSPVSSADISSVIAKQPSPPSSASRTPPELLLSRPLPTALSQEDSSVSPPPPKLSPLSPLALGLGSPPPPISQPLPPMPPVVPPPPPMTEPDLLTSQNQVPGLIVPVATERLISSANFGRSNTSGSEGDSLDGSSISSALLPSALEHTVKVKKEEEPLGINVELVDEGKNGVMVTSIAIGGPFARDGRIHAGDYLVAINNESLRNVTNAQARAILRRCQLFSKDLSVSYIPATDAEVHRQTLLIQQTAAKDIQASTATTTAAVVAPSSGEETNREVGEESVPLNKAEQRKAETVRTPADGQEALPEDKPATTTIITATTTTPSNKFPPTTVTRAPIPYSRSTGPPPPVPAKPGSLSTATTETSTVFINTSEIPVPQATQPTVQKRVVTHVTIFPSPPPDLVTQVSRVNTVPAGSIAAAIPKRKDSAESVKQEATPTAATTKSPPSAVSPVVSPTEAVEEPAVAAPPPPPPPFPTQEAEPSSVTSEPDLEQPSEIISVSSEPSAQVVSSSVVKSEPEVSLQQSSSLEMVNKEPLSSSEKEKGGGSSSEKGGGGGGSSGDESSALLLAKHWGPERLVQVPREPGKSLGISIVGGKVDLYNAGPDSGSAISGIFIKNVLLNSPAGRTGQLKTGDRILSVDDVDLRSASHERAVEVIRAAGNPVRFLVQSLVHWSDGMGVSIGSHEDSEPSERSEGTERTHTQSQSYSQTVHSTQSCSSATTDTCTGTCTSTTGTSRTETNGRGSGSESSTSLTPSLSHTTIAKGETPEGLVEEDEDVEEEEEEEDEDDEHVSEVENALRPSSPDEGLGRVAPSPVSPARSPSPEVIQPGLADEEKQVIQANMEAATKKEAAAASTPAAVVTTSTSPTADEESAHSSEEDDEMGDDERSFQGRIRTKAGIEIDRGSSGNVRRSKDYNPAKDDEPEDEFGYTLKKIQKRWGELAKSHGVVDKQAMAKLVVADLERTPQGLGISLAGHRDRMIMATYVCGINPAGIAHKTKALEVGDEILEVNGLVIHGRCHLNSSAIIKSLPHSHVKIVALRKPTGLEELSVKPIVQFPVSLKGESPEEKYANYKGLRLVNLKKGPMGLGIMIMEGRHAELGQGIFISDIQEGSVAEQAGLFVGDMILAVNGEDMVGADYDHAANTLKKTEGNVIIVVCNASKGDDGPASRRASATPAVELAKLKEGEQPAPASKELMKPKLLPKPSKIPSPSKLIASVIPSRGKSSPTPPAVSPIIPMTAPSTLSTSAITSPTGGTHGPVPSVVVKPATPSPKMPLASAAHHHVAPTAPQKPPTKLAITMKPRASSIGSDTGEPHQDPTTCEIKAGRETTIEINKDKMGLGLSIVGGSDTLLGSIIIHEVYADGAAAKDSRLRPGDQLLSVNNEDFQNISHTKALAALRQTPTKVRMVVYRDEAIVKEDDMYDIQDVELVKKSGKGLGLSIVGRKNGTGVFISDVVPGGIAELHGGLMKGDMIISVNGHDLKSASQEEAAAVLKTVIGPIRMKIARLKAASSRNKSSASTPATVPATPISDNVDMELEEGVVDDELNLYEEEDDDLSYAEKPSIISNSSIIAIPPLLSASPSPPPRHLHNSNNNLHHANNLISTESSITTATNSTSTSIDNISHITATSSIANNSKSQPNSMNLCTSNAITPSKIPITSYIISSGSTSASTQSLPTSTNSITEAVSRSTSSSSLSSAVAVSTSTSNLHNMQPPQQSQTVSVSSVSKTTAILACSSNGNGHNIISKNTNSSNSNGEGSNGTAAATSTTTTTITHGKGSPTTQVRQVVLERGPDGLGFSIVGGHGSPHGNLPIYVKTVFDKGAAVHSGLKRGDQILAVNAIPCEGLTHLEAVTLLKNVKGSVNLTILS